MYIPELLESSGSGGGRMAASREHNKISAFIKTEEFLDYVNKSPRLDYYYYKKLGLGNKEQMSANISS